jgi:ketosteroid isomerase-like protein
MPRPKIPVEDRLEIQELFAYYAWGLNTGDAEQVLSCFTEDASFEHQPQGIFHGHEQIKILLSHLILTPRGEQEMHVKAYSTLVQYQVDYKRNFVFGLANWDNVVTKASGEWLFKSMRIHKWMGEDVPWVGEERAKISAPTGPLL